MQNHNQNPQPKIQKALRENSESLYFLVVGTARFELATTCPPDKCATRLRYAPTKQSVSITLGIDCQESIKKKGK